MKIILCLVLLSLLLLLTFILWMHRDVNDEASYVTSQECQDCHRAQYDSWRENTLHPYIFLPVSSPDAKILGDFESDDPAVTFERKEIEFVLGSKWEQVYARIIDGEYFPFPAKWYVIQKRWVPYKINDWHDTPMSYQCNGCHTTGFDPNTLEFAEFGVGCEACHGPGSLHVQHEKTEHDPFCSLCHKDENPENEEAEAPDIVRSVSPSVCGQCHSRGTTPTGDVIKGSQFNFPADFVPGDDLRSVSFSPSTPENDNDGKNWWGNGLSKNRHQEFSDWNNSGHSKSLTHLLESFSDQETSRGVLTPKCLQCHSTDYRNAIEGDKPTLTTASFGVTCIACHEPHGQDREIPGTGDRSAICVQCHTAPLAKDHKRHFPCPEEQIGCADCHMPKIVNTGGFFSLSSHAFKIVRPETSIENNMPNSCQNSGCHANRSLDWTINAFIEFFDEDEVVSQ